jgi:hypothetical protein
MLVFKDYIVELLPDYIKVNDSYKDGDQKGFVVRFMEIFGEELDEQTYLKLENEPEVFNLEQTSTEFLQYFAYMLGRINNISQDEEHYRRLLSFIISIWKIKGTEQSYISLFYTLGLTTTINELPPVAVQYDMGHTYDEAGVIYDDYCPPCSNYELSFTGVGGITAQLYQKILDLVKLIEPINAKLTKITYNGSEVQQIFITVEINEEGDLEYNNDNDPDLVLSLDSFGNLIIDGPLADRYFIQDGDLYFILI